MQSFPFVELFSKQSFEPQVLMGRRKCSNHVSEYRNKHDPRIDERIEASRLGRGGEESRQADAGSDSTSGIDEPIGNDQGQPRGLAVCSVG